MRLPCKHLYSKRPGRRRRRPTAKAAHITDRISIDQRPEDAKDKKTVGHYEFDAIVGSRASITATSVAVVQERCTKLLSASLVASLAPKPYADSIASMLRRQSVQTLTTDNGLENRSHQNITTQTGAQVYFTDPYSSWQKGGVENANKLIRRHYPKGTDFSFVPHAELYQVIKRINKKPRRCLG
jgi:transposase, IS30 family